MDPSNGRKFGDVACVRNTQINESVFYRKGSYLVYK